MCEDCQVIKCDTWTIVHGLKCRGPAYVKYNTCAWLTNKIQMHVYFIFKFVFVRYQEFIIYYELLALLADARSAVVWVVLCQAWQVVGSVPHLQAVAAAVIERNIILGSYYITGLLLNSMMNWMGVLVVAMVTVAQQLSSWWACCRLWMHARRTWSLFM